MRAKLITFILAALFIVASPAAFAAEEVGQGLTIYNGDLAVVKDVREIDLSSGTVKFRDVAKRIDATSVHFKSLTDPKGTTVLEQNYEFDLVSASKLLEKYIDRQIKIVTEDGKKYSGTLLSFDASQIILHDTQAGKLAMIQRADNIKDIQFPKLPDGLLTKPTLVWLINANQSGRHKVKVTYMTGGLSWGADYTLVTNKKDTMGDMSGWVTITNRSGATYKNAKVKLIAGDVHRVNTWGRRSHTRAPGAPDPGSSQFSQKSFADYHMYTLKGTTTVKDNQVKQVELLNVNKIKISKKYRYQSWGRYYSYYRSSRPHNYQSYGVTGNKKINVFLEFDNSKTNNMGIPLPKGKVRVYKRDEEDDSLEFIGEDLIDHTPRDERIKLYIGNAFDIVGERKQTDFSKRGNTIEETFEIKIRNHKKETVTVEVWESLHRWANWRIKNKSMKYDKYDAQRIVFKAVIEPDQEKVITYTVHYWGW